MQINTSNYEQDSWKSISPNASKDLQDRTRIQELDESIIEQVTSELDNYLHPEVIEPNEEGSGQAYDASAHWVGRPICYTYHSLESSAQYILDAIPTQLKKVAVEYDAVMEKLTRSNPELEGRSLGFSLNANGRIVVANTSSISSSLLKKIEVALNESPELVASANRLARMQIKAVEMDDSTLYGRFELNMETYSSSIDIGATISSYKERMESVMPYSESQQGSLNLLLSNMNYTWLSQLYEKGSLKSSFLDNWTKIEGGELVKMTEEEVRSTPRFCDLYA